MSASAGKPLARLFSLSGLLPLGLFVIAHLALSARALAGESAFARAATVAGKIPVAIVALVILLPLAFHAIYGAYLAVRGESLRASVYSQALGRAMRVTGLIAFAYVAFHLYGYARTAFGGLTPEAEYTLAASRLSSATATFPLNALVEACGSGVVLFHLSAGLWGFSVANGWADSRSSQRLAAVAFAAIGAALFLLAFDTVVLHATGARLIGRDDPTPIDLGASDVACAGSAMAAAPTASSGARAK